jgi:hypothetical protein
MSAKDISRFIFQPNKRYSSVRMQQGRVILDSDWNESERIDDEELRRTLLDIVCSKGTSNDGFRVTNVRNKEITIPDGTVISTYDFDFQNGSFYIGGLRFETDANGTPERFLSQHDWLQIDAAAENLPVRPDDLPAGGVRNDLVYLRGWEQCVTVVEDSELRERALGGPDTSVRMRRMRRVEVSTNVADTCAAAFKALEQEFNATITREYELQSKARLTVVPNPGDITEDPCKPAVPGGYLGADNQTIRVQLTAPNRLIWGYDNASPFYRVQVENIPDVPSGVDGTNRQIRFLTLPRDQAAQPLAGQAVEILPWGALLPNQEKVAEFQGRLFTVESSFDPEDHTLTITQPVPQEFVQWLAGHSQFESNRDEEGQRQYFYLRLWTGGSGDAAEPDHEFTPGTPVPLEGTGLSVTLSDAGLSGDFWIIAARPSTPTLVVPWELLDSAAPAGPRYFLAPLALIRWSRSPATGLFPAGHDCRERFRPLCNNRGCCTVSVGDGITSHGDFDSIEEAVAFLPDEGGEVCLLPGQHRANVTIAFRRNVTIKGCGIPTQVIPRGSSLTTPIFHVVDSQRIRLYGMEMITLDGTAILLEGSKPDALKEADVFENRIIAGQAAIQVVRGLDIQIHENRIRMLDKEGSGIAIQVLADDCIIDHNNLGVIPVGQTPPPAPPPGSPDPTDPCADPVLLNTIRFLRSFADHIFGVLVTVFPAAPFTALGGIQIAAGSERVKVLDNVILGGAGNGILLGGTILQSGPIQIDPVPPRTIESTANRIEGSAVRPDGTGLAGVGISFTRQDGKVQTVISGSGGFFSIRAEPNQYQVALSSPGFEITGIAVSENSEFGRFHRINVAPVTAPVADDSLAFLYEIQIDRNEISLMGLCGIGFPIVAPPPIPLTAATLSTSIARTPAAAALLSLLGNPVMTLGIHRNHIHDCLQLAFDPVLRAEAAKRGFGGISLGLCADVEISSNRIEQNGPTHVSPACGIFVQFGERVVIHDNQISDNGILAIAGQPTVDPGIRGGIVLTASTAFGTDRHAARIQDNVVHQPAGNALRILSTGATSVSHNYFVTDINGPDAFERLVGTVLILTFGGTERLPAGITLFNNNQATMGAAAVSLTSQLILTTDDLGFEANQSVVLGSGATPSGVPLLLANTLLIGKTMRASDSRFKEPISQGLVLIFSLATRTSLLNNTNSNHGDHCILAVNTAPGRAPNIVGNQVVDNTRCQTLNASIVAPLSSFAVGAALQG